MTTEILESTIQQLKAIGCVSWPCEGPDISFVGRKSCLVCSLIVNLKAELKSMNNVATRVIAEILPGKEDSSAEAHFANSTRAGQYATLLVASGDYSAVYVEHDNERYLIESKA